MSRTSGSSGPLAGVRVVEMGGIGPGPFAAMMLADMGADVVRVDRADQAGYASKDILLRNRRSIAVDLKSQDGLDVVRRLVAASDLLIEGFRPGVMERLGVGPEECLEINPKLVYGRMTGWGQTGPLARTAGHDISYIAISGALHGSRRAGELPVPPINLLGDFGGGAMFLLYGVTCALLHARATGEGQVVDANIVDGMAALTNSVLGQRQQGYLTGEPGTNVLDTGAPFYDTYRCKDGKEIAVGALEPKFYAALVEATGANDPLLAPGARDDPAGWPEARKRWAALFATKARDEWVALLEGTDACAAPVLTWEEAPHHPHHVERETFVEHEGVVQAAPAPRLSLTPGGLRHGPVATGAHTDAILVELGYDNPLIEYLRESGAIS